MTEDRDIEGFVYGWQLPQTCDPMTDDMYLIVADATGTVLLDVVRLAPSGKTPLSLLERQARAFGLPGRFFVLLHERSAAPVVYRPDIVYREVIDQRWHVTCNQLRLIRQSVDPVYARHFTLEGQSLARTTPNEGFGFWMSSGPNSSLRCVVPALRKMEYIEALAEYRSQERRQQILATLRAAGQSAEAAAQSAEQTRQEPRQRPPVAYIDLSLWDE